jgi:hypothetical protein
MIINRAGRDNSEEDYHQEILRMVALKNENGPLFLDEGAPVPVVLDKPQPHPAVQASCQGEP